MEGRDRTALLVEQGLEEGRFRVWFQPIYSVRSGAFTQAEALLRLWDRAGRPVSPEIFIPAAEEGSLVPRLTRLVVEQTCAFLSRGAGGRLEGVSINLTAAQMGSPGLAEELEEAARPYGVPPSLLRLELTERQAPEDRAGLEGQMALLKGLGYELWLDDFGTGWAALEDALSLPFDAVKLDRSLIRDLPGEAGARGMLKGLISLFHRMGRQVIGEGAETAPEARCLAAVGADLLQGFWLSRPGPGERARVFFAPDRAEAGLPCCWASEEGADGPPLPGGLHLS